MFLIRIMAQMMGDNYSNYYTSSVFIYVRQQKIEILVVNTSSICFKTLSPEKQNFFSKISFFLVKFESVNSAYLGDNFVSLPSVEKFVQKCLPS